LKTAEGNQTLGAEAHNKSTKHERWRLQKTCIGWCESQDCWIMWK